VQASTGACRRFTFTMLLDRNVAVDFVRVTYRIGQEEESDDRMESWGPMSRCCRRALKKLPDESDEEA
jgi:DNA-directed RNA polymerase subunit N (RpoN/RPB10)